ncbi:protein NEDD1 [Anoplophora glabripennis]|nr:protein NEDD1 [Anoplophora glabripennis]
MFVASASTTVKFHEFPNGNVMHHYQPGNKVEGPIRSISWSRDGNWLSLVPFSGHADVVSVKDQLKLIRTIQDVDEPSCVAFLNSTKKLIALGTKGGQVFIYDIKMKNTTKRFPRASSLISHVDFTAKDTHCVAGCTNGDILLFSNTTNNLSCTLRVPKSRSVTSLRANRFKRNLIIGGSNEGIVVVWDSNVNKVKFTMEAHKAPVTSVAFSPVNSDLVVSTGSDRQFCFYDIIDSKRIASVPVENNITAVDFSPEGTYFVMGSQNGRVYIYDSRNIQEPVHSFSGHTSAVKHLIFQRSLDSKSASSSSISDDSIVPIQTLEEPSNCDSDIFGMFIQIPSNEMVESIKTSGNSMEAGDSFFAALGLDKNNTLESFQQDVSTESTKKWPEDKNNSAQKSTHDKIGLVDSKQIQMSSTPKFFPQNFKNIRSPSYTVNQGYANLTLSDVQTVIKETVKEDVKATLEEIRTDIKFQATHTTYQIKRMLLDFQMAMVREFIKVENFCNSIRDDLTTDSPRHAENNYLMEENEQLKKRIEFLEQQVAFLTVTDQAQMEQHK